MNCWLWVRAPYKNPKDTAQDAHKCIYLAVFRIDPERKHIEYISRFQIYEILSLPQAKCRFADPTIIADRTIIAQFMTHNNN